MFKFFTDKRWHLWSIGGTILILAATWYQVQLDVRINEWFGEFYDTLQKALAEPGAVTEKEFIAYLFTFAKIAAIYILVVIFSDYFTSHWTFRWRTAMAHFTMINGILHHQLKERLKEFKKIHLNSQELWKV